MRRLEETGKYDFWNFPFDVMTTPDNADEIQHMLDDNEIEYHIRIDDVQKLIDNQFNVRNGEIKSLSVDPDDLYYTVYHRYAEIDQWVKDTAARYPDLAKEFIIGRSYEKRVMRALKIGAESNVTKPAMWINSGIHAREWITPATNIWMTNKMLHTYTEDSRVTRLLDMFDLYILPVFNVDGYDYTWDVYRLWRKTRSVNMGVGPECYGVDPNRNWPHEFGGGGTSTNPCSYSYRGEYPLSEVEVRQVVEWIRQKSQTQEFKFFMDIHSAAQMWMNPWGYTYDFPKDYDDHNIIGKAFVDALASVHNTTYQYGTITELLYVASGSSVDWAYGSAGIKYSHATELRDTGEYGFLLPEDQILPTAQETYEGMLAAYDIVMNSQ
uniref:Carboxypeptidase A4-like n=1 Tax=Saccoglossus kowalevskii TaxID=10224 RepID=A0ABM0MQ50_SACKO|nr:PREDICTED: carboxypeptidase A4-like [Saccoglossus kowalevskii]